ncbi:PREDICTED: uncharacterized protein LOC105359008 [Ceratosolen solmsi marchali]|uniref:Uncharacterized protein LOC105359008 n=1 Tax=Ceratosolen solmsi marchali TaxID=326594 RepID=A0AAJ6VJL3_9HYME|nr:PREDICTED: uncharacterized protein LOC105359008 [Ceratosolen solmsi marchali]
MLLEPYFCFLIQCMMFHNPYKFVNALIGEGVREAGENEFGYVVSIRRTSTLEIPIQRLHRCTATLISKQDVITAEHCLRNMLPTAFKIMIGSNDLTRSIETFPLFLITYNDWASNQRIRTEFRINDIAFVKIIGNIPNNVPTAMLGNAPNSIFYGMNVQVAGWGKLSDNMIPRILHTVTLTLISKDECENRIRDFSGITLNVYEKQFCTFAEPYGLLNNGDSGGPVLLFDNIIGVNNGLMPDIDNKSHPEQLKTIYPLDSGYNFANAMVGSNIRNARPNEFPFVISIMTYYPNDDRPADEVHRCTGTLISAQDALTSYHCLHSLTVLDFRLIIGSNDLRQGVMYRALWWWGYNEWAASKNIETEFRQNDIAFIKIYGNVPGNMAYPRIRNIAPTRLFGKKVVTASWGKMGNTTTSRMLQTARLTIISNEECMNRIEVLHGSRLMVHSRRLCSIAEPYVLVLGGDSGGPLLYNDMLVAVNHGTCPQLPELYHPDQVNIHCGIQYYKNFILDVKDNSHTEFS